MQKSIFSLALVLGLSVLGFSETALAAQKTTRTGPRGNTQTTERTRGNGQQTTTRTGPYGKTQTTNRTYGNGQQTTTRTGPYGRTQTTNRSFGY
jgi:hypothetical protein